MAARESCLACNGPIPPERGVRTKARDRVKFCSDVCAKKKQDEKSHDLRTEGYRLLRYMQNYHPDALQKIQAAMGARAYENGTGVQPKDVQVGIHTGGGWRDNSKL